MCDGAVPIADAGNEPAEQSGGPSVQSMALALTAAVASCALGDEVARRLGAPSASLALVSVFATGFASAAASFGGSSSGAGASAQTSSPFAGAGPACSVHVLAIRHGHLWLLCLLAHVVVAVVCAVLDTPTW